MSNDIFFLHISCQTAVFPPYSLIRDCDDGCRTISLRFSTLFPFPRLNRHPTDLNLSLTAYLKYRWATIHTQSAPETAWSVHFYFHFSFLLFRLIK